MRLHAELNAWRHLFIKSINSCHLITHPIQTQSKFHASDKTISIYLFHTQKSVLRFWLEGSVFETSQKCEPVSCNRSLQLWEYLWCPLAKKGFLEFCSENLQKTGQRLLRTLWPFSMSWLIYVENSTWNSSKHPQALRINPWDFLLPLQLSLSFLSCYHAKVFIQLFCFVFLHGVTSVAEKTFTVSTALRDTISPLCFGHVKNDVSLRRRYFFSVTKYNTGLLLAIGPDLSTLGFLLNKSG